MGNWYISADKEEQNYLAHYGVIGMKWGVRHDPQKAYTKATKKMSKLEKRSDKAMNRAGKYKRASMSRFASKEKQKKYSDKARNARISAMKYSKKASKWMKHMEKEFSKQSVVSIEPSVIRTGELMTERYRTLRTFG